MSEDCTINIGKISLSNTSRFQVEKDFFYPNEHVFKNILGMDWFISIMQVKKLEIKKFRSFSFYSHRILVTVRCSNLYRKVYVKGDIFLVYPSTRVSLKKLEFQHMFKKGNNSVQLEKKYSCVEDCQRAFNNLVPGELNFYVSPENFFYFKFSNDNPLIETDIIETRRTILTELITDFSALYKNQELTDVDLKCGDEVFKAHKSILSSRSPVFASMFQNAVETNEVEITDMDSKELSIMLEFIYSGKTNDLNAEIAGGILSSAEQYQIKGLKKACVSFLQNAISKDNVLSILIHAESHDDNLKKISIDFVCKEFDNLKDTEEWTTFQKEKPFLANEVLSNIIRCVYRRELTLDNFQASELHTSQNHPRDMNMILVDRTPPLPMYPPNLGFIQNVQTGIPAPFSSFFYPLS